MDLIESLILVSVPFGDIGSSNEILTAFCKDWVDVSVPFRDIGSSNRYLE
ncbi:hypothetical protein GCWU000341_02216 [Oribacterium sp. oral taxon 078 str. F0262]|nr:hypothetical protein GCWU000341_02216 [Oribacterium sp. oral taxon 078 str. F0262]